MGVIYPSAVKTSFHIIRGLARQSKWILHVIFADNVTGYLLYKTTNDGGANWRPVADETYSTEDSITICEDAVSATIVWDACNDTVYVFYARNLNERVNGKIHYKKRKGIYGAWSDELHVTCGISEYMIDVLTGVAFSGNVLIHIGESGNNFFRLILATSDNGLTWTSIANHMPTNYFSCLSPLAVGPDNKLYATYWTEGHTNMFMIAYTGPSSASATDPGTWDAPTNEIVRTGYAWSGGSVAPYGVSYTPTGNEAYVFGSVDANIGYEVKHSGSWSALQTFAAGTASRVQSFSQWNDGYVHIIYHQSGVGWKDTYGQIGGTGLFTATATINLGTTTSNYGYAFEFPQSSFVDLAFWDTVNTDFRSVAVQIDDEYWYPIYCPGRQGNNVSPLSRKGYAFMIK